MRVLTGEAKGARLRSVRAAGIRPTSGLVKSAIFNILGPGALDGLRVLDLFAGTGALGIEALSQGAARADFVERSPRTALAIRRNLETAGLRDRARVLAMPVHKTLRTLEGPYDLVFMDPPYADTSAADILGTLASSKLLAPGATVILEHAARTPPPVPQGLAQLETRRYGDTAVTYYRKELSA